MTSYDPDTKTAQLFTRYKRAVETERELKPQVRDAAEEAIRAGASNQELAALTGLTAEFFRKIATAIGADNRRRVPTVGAEAEARLAAKAEALPAEPVANPRRTKADPQD
ncbi:hypothetical protein P3T35_003139 [Kitasatospora sp. GP30]|uniref:hypothetical protein n=1 Tax=Kitasatospora sp. GP30 TaxID=3035084 RepID=UPI000C709D25|nr:hypothetical protein [Kitasatospora sp. GP30]MDH6141126.1 hypothetical protein [Kitasatospora sp. GP30]